MFRRKQHRFLIQQDTSDPSEQARFWECHQCIMHRLNIAKMDEDEPRHICLILDVENKKIEEENERIINPAMRKKLKKCIYHPESE